MYKDKKILVLIPARGGSKGLPKKNIKDLCGKPLIGYSIDLARCITCDDNICVSTDDDNIKSVVEASGLFVPFLRPVALSTDMASTNDVLVHAVKYYQSRGKSYEILVLLQPTSPLRTLKELNEAIALYTNDIDMVVSVTKSHAPTVLCEENAEGYIDLVYNKKGESRQNMKDMYEYNGAIYIINIKSLLKGSLSGFTKKIKYVMPKETSIDIDDIYDFKLVESIILSR